MVNKTYSQWDAMSIEEFIVIQTSILQRKGFRLSSISLDREVFEALALCLGHKAMRTKKGHIKMYTGHPESWILTIKRAKYK